MVWEKNEDFVHNYQNIMSMKELQKKIGEIYLGEKTISTDHFFILENIRINFQMDAS